MLADSDLGKIKVLIVCANCFDITERIVIKEDFSTLEWDPDGECWIAPGPCSKCVPQAEETAQTAYCENCDADYWRFANCPQCGE